MEAHTKQGLAKVPESTFGPSAMASLTKAYWMGAIQNELSLCLHDFLKKHFAFSAVIR